jgi:hypothetical protein
MVPFTPILQWLWAAHHNLIAASPSQVAMGQLEQTLKANVHHQHIHGSTPASPLGSTISTSTSIPATGNTPDQLSGSPSKIVIHFQKQSLDTISKNNFKEPNWNCISIQSQGTILCTMSTDSISTAIALTKDYEEFLQQCTAATGFQFMLEYFECYDCACYVSLNQGIISALWIGILHTTQHGMLQNLSPFFVPCHSSDGSSTAPNIIGQHLCQTEGQGLQFSENKLATKQKITLPHGLLSFSHQLNNHHLLLQLIFGEYSLLYCHFETNIDDRFLANPEFFAELMSLLDHRVQSFLENCSSTPDVSKIDFTILGLTPYYITSQMAPS